MAIKKTASLLLCFILMVSVLLAACSGSNNENKNGNVAPVDNANEQDNNGNGETEKPPVEEKRDPVTITVMNAGGDMEFFDSLYAAFTEKYPWITVKDVGSGGLDDATLAKIAAMQSSGEDVPDVVWPHSLGKWIEGGNLEDLRPYYEKDPVVNTLGIREGFIESWEIDGKIYAVPWTDDPWPIVINKDLMNKKGMEMPSNDWTYDDFLQMAKTATDPAAGEYGLSNTWVFKLYLPALLAVANGHTSNMAYMNEDNTQNLFNTPGVQSDLKWIADMFNVHKVTMAPDKLAESGIAEQALFMDGKALFGIAHALGQLDDTVDFEWDILPMPKGSAGQPGVRNSAALGIPSASKHKEEAWMFIRFQFEYEANKWRADNIWFPPLTDNQELMDYTKSFYEGKNFEALAIGRTECCKTNDPIVFDSASIFATLSGAVIPLIDSNKDVSEAFPVIEDYNKRAAEYWKGLGVMK